ncbi:unnamed protein product [Symbiodinium natans]|uniref:Uncharacterized protein n=1 Tax=Symbiodinium natans TaxID=878477 RepID=A0A812IBU9_9DINO|nr:unnamed protein product [Symbiodinium natans]
MAAWHGACGMGPLLQEATSVPQQRTFARLSSTMPFMILTGSIELGEPAALPTDQFRLMFGDRSCSWPCPGRHARFIELPGNNTDFADNINEVGDGMDVREATISVRGKDLMLPPLMPLAQGTQERQLRILPGAEEERVDPLDPSNEAIYHSFEPTFPASDKVPSSKATVQKRLAMMSVDGSHSLAALAADPSARVSLCCLVIVILCGDYRSGNAPASARCGGNAVGNVDCEGGPAAEDEPVGDVCSECPTLASWQGGDLSVNHFGALYFVSGKPSKNCQLAWDLAEQLDESKQVVSMLPASFAGRCMRQDADEEEAPLPSSSTTKLSQDTFSTPTKTACSSDSFSFMEEMETPEKVASSLPAACLDQEREVATETTPDTVDLTNEAEEVQAATADDVVEQAPPNHHESGEPEAPSFPSSGYTELDSEFGEAVLATSCQLASAKTRCAELESESSVLEAEGKQLKSELELMRKQLSDEMQKREPHEPLPE